MSKKEPEENPEPEISTDDYNNSLTEEMFDTVSDASQIVEECLDRLLEKGFHTIVGMSYYDPLSGNTVQTVHSRGNKVLQRGLVEMVRDELVASNQFYGRDDFIEEEV